VGAGVKPLIGITTSEVRIPDHVHPAAQADPPRREMALGMKYTMAVEAAGGLPVVMPPMHDELIGPLLDRLSGVVLSGGPDIDPGTYGGRYHPQLGPTEPDLDHFELQIVQSALERGMPLLAICRGAQVLNVARGGTLHQHLPDAVGDGVVHRQTRPAREPTHGVAIAADSRLAGILRCRETQVNSFHHQGVDAVGERLEVTARAEDGTVEGIEAVDRRFVVGVQWHAECLVDLDEQAALFSALVGACAERAAASAPFAAAGSG
jgi:putative glutamine amidotransferase